LLDELDALNATTRISANLEEIWRSQFFLDQKQTPVSVPSKSEFRELRDKWRQVAPAVDPSMAYGFDVVRFYEDIIAKLQHELMVYKNLVLSMQRAVPEPAEVHRPMQPVKPSVGMHRKLNRVAQPTLRVTE
jgi:hypothetical protein